MTVQAFCEGDTLVVWDMERRVDMSDKNLMAYLFYIDMTFQAIRQTDCKTMMCDI